MLAEHAMGFGVCAKERQATAIAHGNTKPSVDKRLPPVRVVDHVSDRAFAMDVGDAPVESYAITWPAFVFTERHTRCTDRGLGITAAYLDCRQNW